MDSWKEIATYLRRDRRTVQRWEASEGLPVHRHVHQSQATVFAFADELDAWLSRRLESPEPEPEIWAPSVAERPPRRWAYSWAWIATGLTAVLMAVVVMAKLRTGDSSIHFQEHDWILLEGFENRTGEAALNGALRNVLALELSGSTFVSIAPQERVEDALRLMKKPPDTKIDEAVAREVSLRDGGIRALVTGVTEKLGSTYAFTVRVIDPARNMPLALHTETASGQDQIWPAVRKLSNWVRESLGEAMDRIEQSNRKLEKVTTPSLRALELFTQADSAARSSQWPRVVDLTGQAIAEDPEFASAHLWRAFALRNLQRPEWKDEADRALALSGAVSERERYFIVAGNHILYGRPAEAAPVLETLLRLYPDHYFGARNLVNNYEGALRSREAREAVRRVADMRPNDAEMNGRAAVLLLPFDPAAAGHYGHRALDVAAMDPSWLSTNDPNFLMFRFDELWVHEDIRRAHAELERVSNRPNAQPSDNTIITIRDRYILLGEFKLAQKWTEKIDVHQKYRQSMDASLAYVRGDTAQALKILGLPKQVAADDTWFLYAALAPQNIREVTGPMKQVALNLFQGQSDFLHGRVDEALSRFQTSMDALKDDSAAPMYQATGEMFASALERAGKPQKAVAVLEQVTRVRTTYPGGAAIGLLRNQARLARLYRGLGRETEAAAIEARLRKLLIYADPEHPILKQLHQ